MNSKSSLAGDHKVVSLKNISYISPLSFTLNPVRKLLLVETEQQVLDLSSFSLQVKKCTQFPLVLFSNNLLKYIAQVPTTTTNRQYINETMFFKAHIFR